MICGSLQHANLASFTVNDVSEKKASRCVGLSAVCCHFRCTLLATQTDPGTACEGHPAKQSIPGDRTLISEAGCHGADEGYTSHSSPVSFCTITPVVEAETSVVGQ